MIGMRDLLNYRPSAAVLAWQKSQSRAAWLMALVVAASVLFGGLTQASAAVPLLTLTGSLAVLGLLALAGVLGLVAGGLAAKGYEMLVPCPGFRL